MVSIGEHYRTEGPEPQAGVYRVVGASGPITLLRVGDERERRRHTGEVFQVAEAELEAAFDPAKSPDAGITPIGSVRNALQGCYWSVRRFL